LRNADRSRRARGNPSACGAIKSGEPIVSVLAEAIGYQYRGGYPVPRKVGTAGAMPLSLATAGRQAYNVLIQVAIDELRRATR